MPPIAEDPEEGPTDGLPSGAPEDEQQPSTALRLPEHIAPSPPLSSEAVPAANSEASSLSGVGRQVSVTSSDDGGSTNDFVNDLNESIFIHELAMGCTILCQLRNASSSV